MSKIPKQLKTDNARFILIEKKGKKPIENWNDEKNQYRYDDKKLLDWINENGNYAIINKSIQVVIIDADDKKCGEIVKKNLPKTFITKTHDDRFHAYYKIINSKIIGKKILKDNMGDIRGYVGEKSNYCSICSGSIHPTGSEYKSNNLEIAIIKDNDILKVFKKYFNNKKRLITAKKGVKSGERNESAFVIACEYRDKKLDMEETFELMKVWNQKNEPPMNENELTSIINSAYSYEVEKKIPKGLENLSAGIEKMKKPDLLIQIIKEVQKEGLIGEEDTILAITLKIMLRLVKNATPTSSNVVISDRSGGGKDWLTKCICAVLLEKKDYFHRSRLSEKVFTYWNSKKKDFTWDGKVIHLEDPDAEFLNSQAFKVRASGETEETIVKDQTAIDVSVNGKPVIIVTSQEASLNIESVRRWDSCRLNTSEELTKSIMEINMLKEAGLLKIKKDEALREGLQKLNPKEVIIPYAIALSQVLPTTLGMRTAHHKFLDFIKASAVLHQYQRYKTEEGKIIANMFDYEVARFCFYKFGNIKGVPLNIAEEEVIDVLLQESRPMTLKEILPRISRGQSWLYEKVDRLKELDCIKELFITDDMNQKETKHLIVNEKMAWKVLIDGKELLEKYKEIIGNIDVLCTNSGGFPVDKKMLSNGRKNAEFEGGFPEFRKNVFIYLKDSLRNNKNQYNTYFDFGGKPSENDDELLGENKEEIQNGKRVENIRKTYGKDCKTQTTLTDVLQRLRTFVKENRESGRAIRYEMLLLSFDKSFIDECIKRQILIKNGDEYICQ